MATKKRKVGRPKGLHIAIGPRFVCPDCGRSFHSLTERPTCTCGKRMTMQDKQGPTTGLTWTWSKGKKAKGKTR